MCPAFGTSGPYTHGEIYTTIVYNWNLLFYLVIDRENSLLWIKSKKVGEYDF